MEFRASQFDEVSAPYQRALPCLRSRRLLRKVRGHVEPAALALGVIAAAASVTAIVLIARFSPDAERGSVDRMDLASFFKTSKDDHNRSRRSAVGDSRVAAEEARRASEMDSILRQHSGTAAKASTADVVPISPVEIGAARVHENGSRRAPEAVKEEAVAIVVEKDDAPRQVSSQPIETVVELREQFVQATAPEVLVRPAPILEAPAIQLSIAAPSPREAASPRVTDLPVPAAITTAATVPLPAKQPLPQRDMSEYNLFVLQGESVVQDALIDPTQPERNRGQTARENTFKRSSSTNAFLVRFDLESIDSPPVERLQRADVSLFVWSSRRQRGPICLSAFSLGQSWDAKTVTWRRAAANRNWQGGPSYAFSVGPGPASPPVVLEPLREETQANAAREIQIDVTEMVRAWLRSAPNYGLSVSPVIDERIDRGVAGEVSFYASEYSVREVTPKLTLLFSK